MLVGTLLEQAVNCLRPFLAISSVTQLPTMRAQTISQCTLFGAHRAIGLMVMDTELFEYLPRAGFGDAPGLFDRLFEVPAKVSRQSCHHPLS